MRTVPGSAGDNGVVSVPSKLSVQETMDKLEALVKGQGIEVFARLNFTTDAAKAGLKMNQEQMLIFGNPKAGTPLMVASPLAAMDLPLKALAWEDTNGKVWLSYNKPEYILERYGLPGDFLKNIAGIKTLVDKAVE